MFIKYKRSANAKSISVGRFQLTWFWGVRAAKFSTEWFNRDGKYGSTKYINVTWAHPKRHTWWARSVYLYY